MTVVSGTALLGGVTIPSGRTFTLVIDVDTALEEIVNATAVSTNTFTIVRAIDGSSAQEHSAGAVVRHMAIGRDYRDANLHTQAAASYNDGSGNAQSLHGIASGEGDVVGTLKTQTLTNKTLTAPTISNPTITGTSGVETSIVFEGATADDHETTLTVVDPTQDNTITLPNTSGTVTLNSATQTLTNKTLTSPTISGSPVITGLSSAGMVASSATPKDYVDSILGSATAAATSAASAATSAASAATSATSASNSATASATSASAAATSATSAATSATSAETSATAASTSATSAAASATAASSSETAAATSASSASTSASSALTSANSASTSASSALTSATSSATSASAAATSATSAAASATAAATSASSASTSANSAATSATSAAGYVVPDQTGNTGKFLQTDGSAVSWQNPAGDIESITASSPLTGGGTSGAITVGIQAATTAQSGAVQLTDSTASTSVTTAATPNSVKSAYDLADAAVPKSTIDAKGDLIVGSADNAVVKLTAGTNEQRLVTDSATTSGLKYVADTTNFAIAAKGDLLVGTAADTVAALTAGSNGDTLVADSSTSTGLRYNPQNALVNPIINGGMDNWQRGTSFSLAASTGSTYVADRWQTSTGANQASTISRQTTGDTTNLPNIQYCLRMQRDSGQTGTSARALVSSLETTNSIPFAGKPITLSFYARKGADYSPASSALAAYLVTGTGTDQNRLTGSYTGDNTSIVGNKVLTATWQRFVVTGTVPATATEMAAYFAWTPVGTAGAADYFEITGVQVDIGTYTDTTAPAFRRSGGTLQGELAACQRYFQKSYNTGTAPATNTTLPGIVFSPSGNVVTLGGVGSVTFKVEMRVAPTVTIYSYTTSQTGRVSDNAGTDLTASSGVANYIGTRSFEVQNSSGGTLTADYNGFVFHYVASAEL